MIFPITLEFMRQILTDDTGEPMDDTTNVATFVDWRDEKFADCSGKDCPPADPVGVLFFSYTNWRGVTSRRRVLPIRMYYGATEYHPEEQWLLEAWDIEHFADRTFAVADMFLALPTCEPTVCAS